MTRKEDEQPNQWVNKVTLTLAALAAIALASNPTVRSRLKSARARLSQLYENTKGGNEKIIFKRTVIRTQDPEKAEEEFIKFKTEGSKRFFIRPEDVAYLAPNPRTQILLAETMTSPKTPTLSPIHTFEVDWDNNGGETQHYAVRLTSRQFEPPKT